MKKCLTLLVFLFAIFLVSAAHETKLGFQAWVTNTAGAPVTTGDFLINISDSNDCNGDIYSNTFTDEFTSQGIIDEILTLNMDYNKDYYLCPFVNLEQVGGPYNFRGGQGEIGAEDVSFSIAGGNPFNQVLNTTSNVTFYNVTSSGDIWCNSTDCYHISDFLTGTSGNYFNQQLNTTNDVEFEDITSSTNQWCNSTNCYTIANFLASSLGNPFDQVLNTTSDVIFNNTNITTDLLVGTGSTPIKIGANEIHFWDAGVVKYDDVKISSASNTVSIYARDEDDKDKYSTLVMSPTTGFTLSTGSGTKQFYSDTPTKLGKIDSQWEILYALNLSNGTSTVSMDTIVNLSNTYVPYTGATDDVDLGSYGLTTTDRLTTNDLYLFNLISNGTDYLTINDLIKFNVSDQYVIRNPFNQVLNTTSNVIFNTLNTTDNIQVGNKLCNASNICFTLSELNTTGVAGNYFDQQLNTTSTDVKFTNLILNGANALKVNDTILIGNSAGGSATIQLYQGVLKNIKIVLPTLATGQKTYYAPSTVGTLEQVLGITSTATNTNYLGWISVKTAGTGDNINVTTKTANFNWDYADRVVICNATNTNVISNLARAGVGKGYLWTMKRIDTNVSNNCTFLPYLADGTKIDGLNELNLTTQYAKATVVSDGTNYWIVG